MITRRELSLGGGKRLRGWERSTLRPHEITPERTTTPGPLDASQELSPKELTTYRVLGLVAAIVILALGAVHEITNPAAIDPPTERLAVVLLCLTLVAVTFFYKKQGFTYLAYSAFYAITLWVLHLVVLNQIALDYALSLFIVVPIVSGLLRSQRDLLLYIVTTLTLVVAASLTVAEPQVNPLLFTVDVGVICLLSYVISGRKLKVQEELARSEQRYVLASLGANDGLWDWDLVKDQIYYSPRWKLLLGYADHEIGKDRSTWSDHVHPDDIDALESRIQAHLEGRTPHFRSEHRMLHRDGTYRWVVSRGVAVRDAAGRPVRMAGSQMDITDRKRAEEALRHSEAHYRSLIENASDMMSIVRADGTIGYEGPSVRRILGYPPAERIGGPAFELVHPDDKPAVLEEFSHLVASPNSSTSMEVRVRHQDGSWRVLEITAKSMAHEPAIGGVVVNARDITERKAAEDALRRSEEQLRQAQKMEAIGRLAGGVAHDFNNVLTVIKGNVALLLKDAEDATRGDLLEILRSAEHAASLTRQLLAFSRRTLVKPQPIDLSSVVADIERILRRLIGEDIELVTRLTPGLACIKADPGHIEQVIINLVVNARDAMPSGGRLTIETREATLGSDYARTHPEVAPGPYVVLAVSDTGMGMDRVTQERIFEPFFTTKHASRGTGLGLATVYGIVKQSEGHISVYSEIGQGTSFKIYLPRVEGVTEARPRAAPVPARSSGGTETVLLVEDEASVRALAVRVLREVGYTVLEAPNGMEALRLFQTSSQPIHLLLTDVVMPNLSGPELVASIRRNGPPPRVLYTSGYTEDMIVRHGVMNEDIHFLEKPFTPEDLVEKVRSVLDSPEPGA